MIEKKFRQSVPEESLFGGHSWQSDNRDNGVQSAKALRSKKADILEKQRHRFWGVKRRAPTHQAAW
jgi:hypothetical protein